MARHNDPEDDSFRRSLLRAVAGGLVAMVLTFGVTAVLMVVGRDDPDSGPVVSTGNSPTPAEADSQPAETPEPTEADPTRAPEPTDPPPPDLGATDAPAQADNGDVTVQVLDAAGTGTHAQDAADALRDLGYDVIVVNTTARRVDTTTILATPGSEDAAEALREQDPRFAEIAENEDFNPSVDLHILVGPDFT